MRKHDHAKQIQTILSDNGVNLHTVVELLAAFIIFENARDKHRHPADVQRETGFESKLFSETVAEHVLHLNTEYAEAHESADYVASEISAIISKLDELANNPAYVACSQVSNKIPKTFNSIKDTLNNIQSTVEDL